MKFAMVSWGDTVPPSLRIRWGLVGMQLCPRCRRQALAMVRELYEVAPHLAEIPVPLTCPHPKEVPRAHR